MLLAWYLKLQGLTMDTILKVRSKKANLGPRAVEASLEPGFTGAALELGSMGTGPALGSIRMDWTLVPLAQAQILYLQEHGA